MTAPRRPGAPPLPRPPPPPRRPPPPAQPGGASAGWDLPAPGPPTAAAASSSAAAAASARWELPSPGPAHPPAAPAAAPPPQPPPEQPAARQRRVGDDEVFALQSALALIASRPEAGARDETLGVLARLLSNLLTNPHEPKYRSLKLTNAKVQAAVAQPPGGLEFLEACGFALRAEGEGGAAAVVPSVAAFEDDGNLSLAAEGLAQLNALSAALAPRPPPPAAAAPPQQRAAPPSSSSSPPQPEGGARDTQVWLPATPDTSLPDSFFDRTPADVKAEFQATVRRRAAGEQLMTRAMREAAAARAAGRPPGGRGLPPRATLRVRFPEGLILQGAFAAGEPLAAVHEWVCASLLAPAIAFELILPSRGLLPLAGVVRDEPQLLPSCLLNLRLLDAAPGGRCALSDALLATARVE